MLGLSGLSNDMRTIEQAASEGNEQAQLALDVFCFRLARQIGGLATSLNEMSALVFTGGIGENSQFIRAKVVENLKIFGFKLDEQLNASNGNEDGLISAANSPAIVVVNTKEELMIAKDTLALVNA
jgi:acetate kinase